MGKKQPSRSGSRHKPRRMLSVSPVLYRQIAALARTHGRPVAWQARIMLRESLRQQGLWPVPGVPDEEEV